VVVDRDVELLPADAPVAVRPTGIGAEHAFARLPDPAELLGVDVEQLGRSRP